MHEVALYKLENVADGFDGNSRKCELSSTVVVVVELMLSELRDILICMQISSTINQTYPGT